MNRVMKVVVLAGLPLLAVAPKASALTNGVNTQYCLNYLGYSACASAQVTVSGSTLTAVVQNLSGIAGNTSFRLTSFGFYYKPPAGYADLANLNGTPGYVQNIGTFQYADGVTNDLFQPLSNDYWLGGVDETQGNGMTAGEKGTFTFALTFGSGHASIDPNLLNFGWRGQAWNGPNGISSIKCYGGAGSAESEPAGATCGPTVVPEPGSMALLATGLVGLVGAGLVKRRKVS